MIQRKMLKEHVKLPMRNANVSIRQYEAFLKSFFNCKIT